MEGAAKCVVVVDKRYCLESIGLLEFGQAAHVEEATRSDHLEKRCAQQEVKSATPLAREVCPSIYRILLTFPNNKLTDTENIRCLAPWR